MKKNKKRLPSGKAGVEVQYSPCINGILNSTTELCIDIKFIKRKKGAMSIGENLNGNITRDGEDHFTFIEKAFEKKVVHRNPFVYAGVWVNIKKDKNDMLYATFNHPRYEGRYTFRQYCKNAAEELVAIAYILEKTATE